MEAAGERGIAWSSMCFSQAQLMEGGRGCIYLSNEVNKTCSTETIYLTSSTLHTIEVKTCVDVNSCNSNFQSGC